MACCHCSGWLDAGLACVSYGGGGDFRLDNDNRSRAVCELNPARFPVVVPVEGAAPPAKRSEISAYFSEVNNKTQMLAADG